jgi:hypothetical protein
MVQSHVQRDGSGIHLSYYDVDHHKEGSMELKFIDPSDVRKLHDDDRVAVDDAVVTAGPDEPVTLHVEHPDGTSDDIRCNHS